MKKIISLKKIFKLIFFVIFFSKINCEKYIIFNGTDILKIFLLETKNGIFTINNKKSIFFTDQIRKTVSSESNDFFLKKILNNKENKNKFIYIETRNFDNNLYTTINSQYIDEENFFIFKKNIKNFLEKNNFSLLFIEQFNLEKRILKIKENFKIFSLEKNSFKFFNSLCKETKASTDNGYFSKVSEENKNFNNILILFFDEEKINIIGQVFWKKDEENKNKINIFSINDSYIGYGFGNILMTFLKNYLKNFYLTPILGSHKFYEKAGLKLKEDNIFYI